MKRRIPSIIIGIGVPMMIVAALLPIVKETHLSADDPQVKSQLSGVRTLTAKYENWKAAYEATGGAETLTLALVWSKALSSERTEAHGEIRFALDDGAVAVDVRGLPAERAYDVWLVDNIPGEGRSVLVEPGDGLHRLGQLTPDGEAARLTTRLDEALLGTFEVDFVAVTEAGTTPLDGGLLYGAPNLFQRKYLDEQIRAADAADPVMRAGFGSGLRGLFARSQGSAMNFASLVEQGADLFFNETFDGNGRTCGTCHPAENNFTIDPPFIQKLHEENPYHPLFVAEFVDSLNSDVNGGRHFEVPVLMREFGLILENVDGFEDLEKKFVLRSVPHTLAQGISITPCDPNPPPSSGEAPPPCNTTIPPVHRTGWSGDGSPTDIAGTNGSFFDFPLGAVRQHFPKTLSRTPGVDFRFPDSGELKALEAFQLSLGRQNEINLDKLDFADERVAKGESLFLTVGCNSCHNQAGANHVQRPEENLNFDTGVEDEPHPARNQFPNEPFPPDGGFGTEPAPPPPPWEGIAPPRFGNDTFNTTVLVEAADTGPFFHNNLDATLEDAITFYTSDFFPNPADLDQEGIENVGGFLRVLNARENGRQAIALLEDAKYWVNYDPERADSLLNLALFENEDGMEVLARALFKLHEDAQDHFGLAEKDIAAALLDINPYDRIHHINNAIAHINDARDVMVTSSFAKASDGAFGPAETPTLADVPAAFSLDQNFPNPFNPATEIRFALPEPAQVTLRVFDVAGREVATLVDRTLDAGWHSVEWSGTSASGLPVASGVYLYRLEAGDFVSARTMVLSK